MILKEGFNNKIAIITGSANGIGKGVAYRLGRKVQIQHCLIKSNIIKQYC